MEQAKNPSVANPEVVNRHILVIDDNESIHDDYRRILNKSQNSGTDELKAAEAFLFDDEPSESDDAPDENYQLKHALSGEEGLEILREHQNGPQPIAVAFVDMRMPPGWNGLETIEHLWNSDPRLQIVICSAYSDVSWDSIRRQFGKRDNLLILRKPFEPEEVQQLASSLTEKWDQEVKGKTIYTVAPEYPLRLIEVKPKKITAKALICDDFIVLPNGENKKVFRRDLDDTPTTPTRALEQFIGNQESVIEELKEKLAVESGKFEQARILLDSLLSGEASL